MKKLISITAICLFTCLFLSASFAPETSADTVRSNSNYEENTPQEYILKSENGIIVVYKKGSDIPLFSTDTACSGLPKKDQTELEKGVSVSGYNNMKRLVEDYCS